MPTADLIKWMEREAREAAWCQARDGDTERGQTSILVDAVYYEDGEYIEIDGTQKHGVSLADWEALCDECDDGPTEIEIEVGHEHWTDAILEGV